MHEKSRPTPPQEEWPQHAADIKPLVLDGLGGRAARDSGAPVVECVNGIVGLEEKEKTETDRAASQNEQRHDHRARGSPRA